MFFDKIWTAKSTNVHPVKSKLLFALFILLSLMITSCSQLSPLVEVDDENSQKGFARTISQNLSGSNGNVVVSGMSDTQLTVSYTPGYPILSTRLYLSQGDGTGLVLASQDMNNNNGVWTYSFSHDSFVNGVKINLDVLQTTDSGETNIPQGVLADSTTWISFTYGTIIEGNSVDFDSQGASIPASPACIIVSSPATTVGNMPLPPGKVGYIFQGWYTEANGGGSVFDTSTDVTSDVTVYAKWIADPQNGQINLSGPNGSITISEMKENNVAITYDPGSEITSAKLFASIGDGTALVLASQNMTNNTGVWTFGFSHPSYIDSTKIYINILKNENGIETNVPQGTLSDSMTWASFIYDSSITYSITFDSQGATSPANPPSIAVKGGETIGSLPSEPSKTGYSFIGWNSASDGSGLSLSTSSVVNSDMTVYAQWTNKPTYIVSFNSQGADTPPNPATINVISGESVEMLPLPPVKSGFSFHSWNTLAGGSGETFTATTVVNGDLTLYAQWITGDPILPLADGMHMTMEFNNRTNGAWNDDQVYMTMLVRNQSGQWCWVKPSGILQPMSLSDNGQLVKNGRFCANYSFRLSDIEGFQLPPYIDSGRVFVSLGSPIYLTINIDGNGQVAYAAPDLNNETDPNLDVYFDWYEFAIVNAYWAPGNPVGFWGNTTQVDQLSIPLQARVYEKNGTAGGSLIGINGISESRRNLWAAWDREVPSEFKGLKNDYRINAPCKDESGFGLEAPHASYFDSYVNQIWDQYRQETLNFRMDWDGSNRLFSGKVIGDAFIFQMDGQGSIVAVNRKPNTTEIFEASGVLATGNTLEGAIQARISAAFNRHVMEDSNLWDTPSAFYQKSPANYYSKFMHDYAYGGGAYGFAYDDVGNFSGALWSYNGRAVVIDIAW